MDGDGSRGNSDSDIESRFIGPSPTVDNLRAEVALFWNSLIHARKTPEIEEELINGDIESLSLEKLKVLTKNLSQSRKNLNRKLEAINKEIDSNSSKLETLKLVGGDEDETLQHIGELNEIGQQLSVKLMEIDEKLRLCRLKEDWESEGA